MDGTPQVVRPVAVGAKIAALSHARSRLPAFHAAAVKFADPGSGWKDSTRRRPAGRARAGRLRVSPTTSNTARRRRRERPGHGRRRCFRRSRVWSIPALVPPPSRRADAASSGRSRVSGRPWKVHLVDAPPIVIRQPEGAIARHVGTALGILHGDGLVRERCRSDQSDQAPLGGGDDRTGRGHLVRQDDRDHEAGGKVRADHLDF